MTIYILWVEWEAEPYGFYATRGLAEADLATTGFEDDDVWIEQVHVTTEESK